MKHVLRGRIHSRANFYILWRIVGTSSGVCGDFQRYGVENI